WNAMKASCPATRIAPRRRKRRFNSTSREMGGSTITVRSGNAAASHDAAMRPDSPSLVSRTTRSDVIERLVRSLRHRHRAHAIAVFKQVKMTKDRAQKCQIAIDLDSEIMRMPPQMKHGFSSGRRVHGRRDALKP